MPTPFRSTMTAISAEGGTLPDPFTIVEAPTLSGDILVQVDQAPHPNLAQIPTVTQRGTQPAVETTVAPTKFQRIDDDRRDHHPHDDPTSSTTPLSSPPLSPNTTSPLRTDSKPCRVDLDALERKIRSIGERIDRMLLIGDAQHTPPLPVLPHSEPNAPPSTATNPACATPGCIDIDALIKKVSRSLREDFLHLPATADPPDDDATRCRSLDPAKATPDPTAPAHTSRHAPTICYQLSDTPHHLQSALHPVVHTGPTTIAPLTRPPAKPPDPTASQPSVPKHFQQPSNHRKHQITPPGPLAPPPKRTRITSYFRPLYGSSVSPSPSIPLPPFNPVLMDTPDKYTQHNFRPP